MDRLLPDLARPLSQSRSVPAIGYDYRLPQQNEPTAASAQGLSATNLFIQNEPTAPWHLRQQNEPNPSPNRRMLTWQNEPKPALTSCKYNSYRMLGPPRCPPAIHATSHNQPIERCAAPFWCAMSDLAHPCPFVNRSDPRCSGNFSLDGLRQAFAYCLDDYHACPLFAELALERRLRRAAADTQTTTQLTHAHHPVQVAVARRTRQALSDAA